MLLGEDELKNYTTLNSTKIYFHADSKLIKMNVKQHSAVIKH